MQLSEFGQAQGEVVEAACEVGGVSGWVVLGQNPVEGGGFLGGFEGLVQLSEFGQAQGEIVDGHDEILDVCGWVLTNQGLVENDGVSGGFEGLSASP